MIVNFDIIENYAINFNGRHIDLHNNFELVGFYYSVKNKVLKLHWTKAKGEWVGMDEIKSLVISHELITFLNVTDELAHNSNNNNYCLSELTFFSSAEREINDQMIPKGKPNDNDDIIYCFEGGQVIRIHCNQVILTETEAE